MCSFRRQFCRPLVSAQREQLNHSPFQSSSPVLVGFMVDRGTLGQVSSQRFVAPCFLPKGSSEITHPFNRIHLCYQDLWWTEEHWGRLPLSTSEYQFQITFHESFTLICVYIIQSVFRLTTVPQTLPQQLLHRVRYSTSCCNFQYPLLSLRSSNSCLPLLSRLPATSILPSIFPSTTCFRRQFLHKM